MDKIKIGTINIDWCKKTKARLKLVQKVLRSEKFDFLVVTENIEKLKSLGKEGLENLLKS